MRSGLTVVDVRRELGLEPESSLMWSAGNRVREIYRDRYGGDLPEKQLRPKTAGGGSHCFAVYPEEMRPEIERVIRSIGAEAARQPSMF